MQPDAGEHKCYVHFCAGVVCLLPRPSRIVCLQFIWGSGRFARGRLVYWPLNRVNEDRSQAEDRQDEEDRETAGEREDVGKM